LILALLVPAAAVGAPVRFEVEVPSCTPLDGQVFLRSNRLDPARMEHDPLTRVSRGRFAGTFEVATDAASFGYRYSLGICDATACPGIEKVLTYTGSGGDLPDRTLAPGATAVQDRVMIWRSAMVRIDAAGAATIKTVQEQAAFCGPYLSVSDELGAITIGYDSAEGRDVRLEWGPTPSYGEQLDRSGSVRNHFELTGLSPGARVYYRLTEGGVVAVASSFIAPPAAGTPFRFAFIGDTQYYGQQQIDDAQAILSTIDRFDPQLLLSPGDLVASERGTGPGGWAQPELARFSLIFGLLEPLVARAPLMVSMGNHEEDAPYYWDVFAFPRPDAPALDHYYYRFGSVLFVHLYTGTTDGYDFDGILNSQTPWLGDVLAAHAGDPSIRWRVVVLHRGAFSQGARHPSDGQAFYANAGGGRPSWAELFRSGGIDLVLAGHNHNFTVAENDGIRFVTSCAGAPVHELREPSEPTTLYAEATCSADLFRVGARTLSFEAVRTDGRPIPEAAFSLCRAAEDCAELPNPCPEAVRWSCPRPVCRAECVPHPPPALEVTPVSLALSAKIGLPPPAAGRLSVTSSGALGFTAAADVPWLSVTPAAATTPAEVEVRWIDGVLTRAGTYDAVATLTPAQGAPLAVPIRLLLEAGTSTQPGINRPPGPATPLSPAEGAAVDGAAVVLEYQPAVDPDGDEVEHHFELFRAGGTTPVWSGQGGAAGSRSVDRPLPAGSYEWRLWATDPQGAQGPISPRAAFEVEGAAEAGGCACDETPPARRRSRWAALPQVALGAAAVLMLYLRWRRRSRLPPAKKA
jgi:hypothetical protein